MKPLKPREMERMVLERGWTYVRSAGSHRQYARPGYANITIPFHPGDLRARTQETIEAVAKPPRDWGRGVLSASKEDVIDPSDAVRTPRPQGFATAYIMKQAGITRAEVENR